MAEQLSDNLLKNLNNQLVQMDKTLADMSKTVNNMYADFDKLNNVQGLRALLSQLQQLQTMSKNGLRIIDPKTLSDIDFLTKATKEKLSSIAPTLSSSFQRVVNEINQKSQLAGDNFTKRIINAEGMTNEARIAAQKVSSELSYIWRGQQAHYLEYARLLKSQPLTEWGRSSVANQIGISLSYMSNLKNLKPDAWNKINEALTRYKMSLQELVNLQNQADQSQKRFTENINKVEQVELGYKRVEERLVTLSQKWEELNVKKQAGLISEKAFTSQSEKIISEYDKLIEKVYQYHEANRRLANESSRQRRLGKETTNLVNQDKQQNAYKKMAGSSKEMQTAIEKQVKIQNRLNQLRKEYNTLNQKQGRTKEENEALERRKQKIIELINLSKRFNQEQKGSASLGRTLKDYDQMKTKIKQSTVEAEKLAQKNKKIEETAKKATTDFDKMRNTISRLAGALGLTFGLRGITSFVKKIAETRGEFEMLQVSLKSIIGDAGKADELFMKTKQLALESPYTAQQLAKSTKQLAAFRIETGKLYDTTKMLADVAAGLGVDQERLNLAYGHTKASGFLRGMYARQFATAGVNIYGELADYYSAAEKKLVSFKDVYERISKKLVKFEDVEAVFKKLTSEGGAFYNMQLNMTNTVQGQINKLKDAYAQLLDKIGKSHQGTIRSAVAVLLDMVRNWRAVLTVIEVLGGGLGLAMLLRFVSGLKMTAAAAALASREVVGLAAAGARTRVMFEGLGRTLKAHPIILIASALAAAGLGVYNFAKKVKEENDALTEQSVLLMDMQQKLNGYKERIEANNKVIDELGKVSGKTDKQTKELTAAQEENNGIISKLKNNYPEIASEMTILENGYVQLTDKLQKYNDELEREITLTELAKTGKWYTLNEGFTTDAADLANLYAKRRNDAEAAKAYAKAQIAQIKAEKALAAEKKETIDPEREKELKFYQEVAKLDFSKGEESFRKFNNMILSGMYDPKKGTIFRNTLDNFWYDYYFSKEGEQKTALGVAKTEMTKELDEFKFYAVDVIENGFGEAYSKEIDAVKERVGEDNFELADYIADNWGTIAEDITSGKQDPFKPLRHFLVNSGQAITKEQRAFYNNYFRNAFGVTKKAQETAKKLAEAMWKSLSVDENVKKQALADIQLYSEILKKYQQFDIFLEPVDQTKNQPTDPDPNDNGSKAKDSISRLISLLKEMNSEYDKLSKSAYGYVAANDKVRESYREAFKEIFKAKYGTKGRYELDKAFTMINWDEVDTTNKQGVANAMKKLRDYMDTNDIWKHYSKETRAELEKAISGMEVEAEIQVHARIRDDFKREMEQMFSNYDLTLELQGLKINPQQAKDLFPDFEETTIGQLQDKLEEFYQKWNTKGEEGKSLFSEEDLEAYRQMSDKIASDVLKMQKEKAKEYSKFFERELSDRAKLEMQYAQDLAFVRANISDETQRSNIEANLGKKYAEDLHELEWKSFKESDFYVEMMDDISSLPATYTKLMMAKLNEILANPQTLSPRALKEAIKAREKIMQAQIDLQPISVMKESRERIREGAKAVGGKTWWGTRKNLDKEISANQEEINARKGRIDILETERGQLKKYEEAVEEVTNAEKTLSQTTKDWLDENEGDIGRTLSEMKTQYDTNIDRIKEIRDLQLQGNTDSTLNDELTRLQEQNATLKNQIPYVEKLVEKYSALSTVISTIQQSKTGDTTMGMIESGVTSADVGEEVQQTQEEVNQLEQTNAKLKDSRKAFDDYVKGLGSINQAMGHTIGKFKDLGNAWYDTYEALGGETDVLTDAWKEFGNTMVDTITRALEMIPTLVAGFVSAGTSINAALGIIGLIAEAIQLVITLVGALAKVHDAGYEKEIQAQQKEIDNLARAYERLEKQIDRTLHVSDYMRTYDDSIENIREQIQATEQQLQAERNKKDSDEDKIGEYEKNIEDLYDKERELREKMVEDLGGIGKDNYRSWAEGFVSAWKDAFLETGDGLDALQEHFDEFLQEWFVKQATMRIAVKALERVMGDIDNVVSDDGYVNWDELQRIRQQMALVLPELNERLSEFAGMWDLGGEGALSGLAAGIQGITEEQANILEAYWNSVRLYTASIDTNVAALATAFGVGTGVNTNPMLQQLTLTAQHTNDILLLLESVRTNNGSGNGIRVISV